MVGLIRFVPLALYLMLANAGSIINSNLGFPSADPEISLEWGAAALNMTANLFVQTHSAPDGGTPENAATVLRKLSSKLMDNSSGQLLTADAKLARKLGANALKLGSRVLASAKVDEVMASDFFSHNESGHPSQQVVVDHHEKAKESVKNASSEWSSRFPHEKFNVDHGKHIDAAGGGKKTRNVSQRALNTARHPSYSYGGNSLDNIFMSAQEKDSGMFEDSSMATQHRKFADVEGIAGNVDVGQTCSFSLTLSRSHGDKKNFHMQVTSAMDDSFRVQGCSKHGCDPKGFCAHQCLKQGAAGINVIKNQHGEEVGYASCCSEKNVIVHTDACAGAPLDSKLAADLAHRFPSIAGNIVKRVIRRANGDVTLATEELRNLASAEHTWDHNHWKPSPAPRLRRSNVKEMQFVSHVTPSKAIDQIREEAQKEQSADKGRATIADPKLRLVVKDMPRTGGPLFNSVLSQMLGQHHLVQYVDEHTPFTSKEQHDFVISTMRNPCDWYVSLWASAPQSDRELLNVQYGTVADPSPFFDRGNANRTKFSQWLKWVQGGLLLKGASSGNSDNSVMSLRYWESLIGGTNAEGYSTTTLASYAKGYEGRQDVNAGLQAFAFENHVDCWVSDESFAMDVQRCLGEFQERSGVSLNWEPFYQRLGGNGGHGSAKFESLQRKSCKFYYDQDDAKSVLYSDDHLFKAFNYDTCCGPTK